MPTAEFEEREYETAALIELAEGNAPVLTPGQVAEKILGYDAAAHPVATNPVWEVLRVPRPAGLHLLPVHWPETARPSAVRLPSLPVSLILQHKRPTYLYGPRAAQWSYWRRPYYRFELTSHQQRVLRQLEQALGGEALVRYASPAFWRRQELELAHTKRTVLSQSGFVSPAVLHRHRVWTYVKAGEKGRANPRGVYHEFEAFDAMLDEFLTDQVIGSAELAVPEEPLKRHLGVLGVAANRRRPKLRQDVTVWTQNLRRSGLDLAESHVKQLADLASIVTVTTAVRADWCLLNA